MILNTKTFLSLYKEKVGWAHGSSGKSACLANKKLSVQIPVLLKKEKV
jgi:hypothetical protein